MEPGCPVFACRLATDEYDMGCDTSTDYSPYHTRNFLPFGTLVVATTTSPKACGKHWHVYSAESEADLATIMVPEDNGLLRALRFLISHKFVTATFRCDTCLIIRVYLVPFDLANVEGILRRRDIATLSSARPLLRAIMSRLSYGRDSWEGNPAMDRSHSSWGPLNTETDTQSFVEIYNTLPSPVLTCPADEPHSDLSRLNDAILRRSISGLRTSLYGYQRRSVAFMAQKELAPGYHPDPLYVPTQGLGDRTFFIQPGTLEVLQNAPIVSQSPGGILCEELGTGKTVIVLALILATMDRLSSPQESILDPRPTLTPLALQFFPFPPFRDARHRASQRNDRKQATDNACRIPKLTEILLHRARTHPVLSSAQQITANLPLEHLQRAYENNIPFYHHYEEESLEIHRTSRNTRQKSPRVMYLTSATLIVVPATLLHQWTNEINKHCDDTLKYLAVEENGKLPPARILANRFDLILMSHARFARESGKDNIEHLHTRAPCKCPIPAGQSVRVPECTCGLVPGVSPLLQIRWKRLIIDEGHVASAKTLETNLMLLVKRISVQYKWIVTGTPTTNLMGLRFGENSSLTSTTNTVLKSLRQKMLSQEALQSETDADDTFGSCVEDLAKSCDIDDTLEEPFPDSTEDLELRYPDDESEPSRKLQRWTKQDREDLKRLGNMLIYFLEVPRLASNPSLFTSHVIDPLMNNSGTLPGSVRVLRQIMESTMIRHRVEDIENEVTLPPLHQETVLLDMDPYAVTTYNVMQSSVIINAVDSERVGSDYLLHSDNVKDLRQTIENMSQAMFWHVDDMLFNVDERLQRSEEYMDRAAQKLATGSISREDFDMFQRALDISNAAARDPVWRALNLHPNVFSRVYNMPGPIYKAWSSGLLPDGLGLVSDVHHPEPHYLMIPDRLKSIRMFLIKKPLSSVPNIIDYGNVIAEEDSYKHQVNMERARAGKSLGKHDRHNHRVGSKAENSLSVAARKESVAKLVETQAKRKSLEANDHTAPLEVHNTLYDSSPMAGVELRNTTSSKLNYILKEIQQHSPTSKFLIFSRSPLTLMYIAEALAVIGVQYKHSIGNLKALQHDVMTFETSETYRVFLMELKHGARGLNMVSASRVIFCEPVWQADAETQAIKRAHRIGQISPVSVKTVAIRDTHEELMVKRREDLKRGRGISSGKLPELADDISMRDFIAHPTFLPEPGSPLVHLRYTLLPSAPAESTSDIPMLDPALGLASPGLRSPPGSGSMTASRSSVLTIRVPPLKSRAPPVPLSAGTIYLKVQKATKVHLNTAKVRIQPSLELSNLNSAGPSHIGDQEMLPPRKKAKMNVRFRD